MKRNNISRKIISILVSLILIICSFVPCFIFADAAVWGGETSLPALSAGVYQIATGENLAWFANAVNSGNQEIKGKLTADIQLNSAGSTSNEWTPIGTADMPFKGLFDGDGHTVSGVYIDSENTCQGLFGYVSLPENEYTADVIDPDAIVSTTTVGIQNLNVTNSVVKGRQNVGGIVGCASELGIKNCYFSGTVQSTENSAGGIIGWASSDVTVVQCHTSGTVTGNQRVGGIAGYQNGNSVVTMSYSNAEINGSLNVGGITGTVSSAFVEGCFFLGKLTADGRAGGIVGYSAFGTVKGVYADAEITAPQTAEDMGGAIGIIYDGKYGSVFYNYGTAGFDGPVGTGRTAAEMQASSFVKELNAAKVFFCFDYTNDNSGYPVLVWMIASDVWLGELSRPTLSGNTYLISKPSELAWFSALVNGTLGGYDANPSANARVTDDLLMNLDLNDDSTSTVEWTPIGTSEYPYTGTFDGNGHNIAGLYTTEQSGGNTGLFGYVGTGTVKNTIVIDGKISGTVNIGGIAGYLNGGTIQNCCCASEVAGKTMVGGIVGYINYNTSSTSTVTLNSMLGTVTGIDDVENPSTLMNIGGIAGYNNRGSIDKCFTYGKINAPNARNVGGIIGNNASGTLTSSYNTSLYVCGKTYVGGLIGNNSGAVNYCYTSGEVSGTGSTKIGIAFGETTGSVSSNSFDSTYLTLSLTNTDGAVSKTQSQMTGTSALSNMGLSSGTFTSTADDTYFYYFPQISSLAYSSYKIVKNGSLESVRRVREEYNTRVQIDGRADTYYETLAQAVSYAEGETHLITPTVYIIRDIALDSTVNVTGEVRLFSEENITLTRKSTLTNAMFNVTGNLTIGSDIYGNDTEPCLTVDGNAVAAKQSAFTVQTGGKLSFESGIKIMNIATARSTASPVRGAVISNQGDLKISGGIFGDFNRPNIGLSSGGVIYSHEGNVEISGGTFRYNEATQGAVIYNHDGYAEIKGGTFSENECTTKGGVSVSYGIYAQTVIGGKAEITKNSSPQGGAISAQNNSATEITGGTITANTASSMGGAIFNESEIIISGGVISENSANGSGSGIYNNATLTLKGKAQISSDNDVFLPKGKTVAIEENLTCSGYAAVITPATYSEGLTVLSGEAMMNNYRKIGLSNSQWHTLADGKITSSEGTPVARVEKSGTGPVEYVSLASAFASVKSGEDAIIKLIADTTVNSEIKVNGNVTLLCGDNTSYSVTRGGSYSGNIFNVMPNAVLHLGESINDSEQQSQADFKSGSDNTDEGLIIIDGGKNATGVSGKASVNVQYNAELYMHEGAVIQNGLNPSTSTSDTGIINVSGNMYMFGGTIRNNSAFSGAVCVTSYGNLNTYGGVIYGNTSVKNGSAVYAVGTVTRYLHSYNYTLYDSENPEEIIGQSEPVKVSTTQTDIYIDKDNTVFLNNNMIYTDTSSSEIFIRDIDDAPPESTADRCVITLALQQYTVGAVAVTGEDVAASCNYFALSDDMFYVASNGTLGLKKILVKDDSALSIKSSAGFITGFTLGVSTPSLLFSEFMNGNTDIKFYNENNEELGNSDLVTTGTEIRLVDSDNTVIDSLTAVVYGDINSDCHIDGQDAVIIRAIAGEMLSSQNLSAARMEASDVNRDGSIMIIDAETAEECGVGLQTIEQ